MSKLSKLLGESKTYTIGGIELELKPRTLEEIELVMDISHPEKESDAMKALISKTLRDSVPDATDEELNGISFAHFKQLSEAIIDVNGLTDESNN